MTTKHTPGPWRPSASSKAMDAVIAGKEARPHDRTDDDYYGGPLICESVMNPSDRDLIAASPDLLAACIAGVNALCGGENGQQALDMMKAAIAKATGGEA